MTTNTMNLLKRLAEPGEELSQAAYGLAWGIETQRICPTLGVKNWSEERVLAFLREHRTAPMGRVVKAAIKAATGA